MPKIINFIVTIETTDSEGFTNEHTAIIEAPENTPNEDLINAAAQLFMLPWSAEKPGVITITTDPLKIKL